VEFLSGIKQTVGNFLLNKNLSRLERDKKLVSFSDARNIGIVYLVSNQGVFNKVKLLIRKLNSPYRQVMALGFVNRDSIPDYCVAANSGYYFDKKDLNWYGAPNNDYIKEFINKEFDIIIDLTLEDVYVLQYIVALSKSKLKVGRFSKSMEKYYDLMIKNNNNTLSDEYIDQILYYLDILKSK
jgi:hypothetical protein